MYALKDVNAPAVAWQGPGQRSHVLSSVLVQSVKAYGSSSTVDDGFDVFARVWHNVPSNGIKLYSCTNSVSRDRQHDGLHITYTSEIFLTTFWGGLGCVPLLGGLSSKNCSLSSVEVYLAQGAFEWNETRSKVSG